MNDSLLKLCNLETEEATNLALKLECDAQHSLALETRRLVSLVKSVTALWNIYCQLEVLK